MLNRLPYWFRQRIPGDIDFVRNRLRRLENSRLSTVCLSAKCPNIGSCFEKGSVTFIILGDVCSRNCSFCAVSKGAPDSLNPQEAYSLALAVNRLNLRYAVVTSVSRDDLAYGGATQFARCVYLIRRLNPGTKIELLIPDFNNRHKALAFVVKSRPEIIAHNLETVERFYPKIRPVGNYSRSLSVLKKIRKIGFAGFLKSGIMLGFGEKEKEILKALEDLRSSAVDILTLGQYLAPSDKHTPVKEFVSLGVFELYRQKALELGFRAVYSGPLVRSSHNAETIYSQLLQRKV